ncbi:MAG TPA: L,D-transpeptidase [Longimicrobiales bacterium]
MMRATILAALLAWGGAGAGTLASTPTATRARTQDPTCAAVPGPRAPPDTVPALALVLNVPAARLDALEYGRLARSWDVAVGERRYPTPLGSFWISEVTWNPWWVPPQSDWAAGQTRTPPGPANPMGRVKLRFFKDYYLHGTPLEETVGRAASHGCVRLRNAAAIELATLVHRHAGPALPPGELERLVANPAATRTLPLATAVPLQIVYRLAEIRDGRLILHPDVYRLGAPSREHALAALEEAGYERARVAVGRVDELLARARRGRVSAPVDSLLLHAGGPEKR